MGDTCPQCGNEYQKIGQHWSHKSSSCSHPSLTQHQKEMITGILMGDGAISRCSKNPRLQINMISPNYLEYVASTFGILGSDVSMIKTAEESAKENRNGGYNLKAKVKNYSDIYQWRSMTHPELQEFAEWYSTGEKIWPENIKLTPTALKHWYCGDGCWRNDKTNNYITISMANEAENTDKVDKIFNNANISPPNNYSILTREDGCKECTASFTVEQSKELWEYMGEPLPDFEYKWPDRYC